MTTWHVWVDEGESLWDGEKIVAPDGEYQTMSPDAAAMAYLRDHAHVFDGDEAAAFVVASVDRLAWYRVVFVQGGWHHESTKSTALREVAEDMP